MKITSKQLRQIIKEELEEAIKHTGQNIYSKMDTSGMYSRPKETHASGEMFGDRARSLETPLASPSSDSTDDAWNRFVHSVDGANGMSIYALFDMYQQQHPERAQEMRDHLNYMHSHLERPL